MVKSGSTGPCRRSPSRCEAVPHASRLNEPLRREGAMTGSDMLDTGQTTSVDGSER